MFTRSLTISKIVKGKLRYEDIVLLLIFALTEEQKNYGIKTVLLGLPWQWKYRVEIYSTSNYLTKYT